MRRVASRCGKGGGSRRRVLGAVSLIGVGGFSAAQVLEKNRLREKHVEYHEYHKMVSTTREMVIALPSTRAHRRAREHANRMDTRKHR